MGSAMKFGKYKEKEFKQLGWDAFSLKSLFDEKQVLKENTDLLC